MKRVHKSMILLTVLVIVSVLYGCFPAFAPIEIAGTWSGTITWTEGPSAGFTTPITLILTQDGADIAGEIGLMGPGSKPFSVPITEGTAGSSSFTIEGSGSVDVLTPPVNVVVSLHGESDGQTMTGTGSQKIGNSTYAFTWTASLTAAPTGDQAEY